MMSLSIDSEFVCGGIRIIDSARPTTYHGVALVVQRDAHPTVIGSEISEAEAMERAKLFSAAPAMYAALTRIYAESGESPIANIARAALDAAQ